MDGYGCSGVSSNAYGLIANEVERIDSSYRSMLSVQSSSLVMHPIHKFGSEDQKARLLPLLAAGELVGCFGLTEPDAGSDPGGMSTKATYDGTTGEFILNGAKHWITNAPIADVCVVWARLDGVVRGFIVERGADGLSTPKIPGKFSLRASPTGSIVMEDCRIPRDNILPKASGLQIGLLVPEFRPVRHLLGGFRCRRSLLRSSEGLRLGRIQFGAPLSANQLVQKKLADVVTEFLRILRGPTVR